MIGGLLVAVLVAQELSPEMARLGQIRKRMADNLASLPDYTCTQTFERAVRGPDDKLQFRDRVRLAVAFIGGQELFAWPESGKFEHRPLDEYVQTGSISTGNFAVHAFNLFRSSGPVITYGRGEEIGGRLAHRYDFRVPLLSSNSTLRVRGREGRVAHRGSFWVDAETFDLLRVEIHADEIPPDLSCARASDVLEYGRGRLGEADYLLPRATEAIMVDRAGFLSRNQIRFSDCRRYTAESSISFDAPAAAAPQRETRELRLPEGLELHFRLETPIDGSGAVGDPVRARLGRAVKAPGAILEEGAAVEGRIRRLEEVFSPRGFFVGLEFFAVRRGNDRAVFTARLIGPRREEARIISTADGRITQSMPSGLDIDETLPQPGVGVFRIPGSQLRLKRGFRTIWQTTR